MDRGHFFQGTALASAGAVAGCALPVTAHQHPL